MPQAERQSYQVTAPPKGTFIFSFRKEVCEVKLTDAIPIRNDCPSCGLSGDVKIFARRTDSVWAECQCGLVYLQTINPKPEQAPDRRPKINIYERRRQRRIAKSRHQILDVMNHTGAGPLLDIGCSLGYTLEAALSLGIDSTGIDVDSRAVECCRQMGFLVKQASMSQLPFDDDKFQIVTMKHVLEHTPEPRTALREVHRVLRPGGGLFIAVPHLRYHKAIRSPETHRFFNFLGDGKGDGHYVYYTPNSLCLMLNNLGFKVVKINPHLIHMKATVAIRFIQAIVSPIRWLIQRALTALRLRKEFWLVAVKI